MNQYYEAGTVAHEKGKALDNFFDPNVLAERNEKEALIAESVKTWVEAAAAFIGRSFGMGERKKFLELTPSIPTELKRARKRWPSLIRPTSEKEAYVAPNWDLSYSMRVRVDRLASLAETVRL